MCISKQYLRQCPRCNSKDVVHRDVLPCQQAVLRGNVEPEKCPSSHTKLPDQLLDDTDSRSLCRACRLRVQQGGFEILQRWMEEGGQETK
ncbi:hypothetical protein FZEAL_3113 [Fusarium zealandicum]|uniref:Uncharacterized protein n=1 Tax=Fusarium zealandicum TaxID=1053134 RepID=A0A8H4UPS5_9HYPO|nr:hypothetical protein FZEAL_3113 [Fusarium zealandicum]